MSLIAQEISQAWPYAGWFVFSITAWIAIKLFLSCWIFFREETYKHSKKLLPWTFLQIKVPRENLKGPKAMEQFFAAVYPLRNVPATSIKKWWDGEVPRWHTLDIIGENSEVKFYLRTSSKLAAAVTGLLYAQYSDIEIYEVEDPLLQFPQSYVELAAKGWEMYGNELQQGGSPAISIRTYSEFEQEIGDEKGRIIDPFSVLLELISSLKPGEVLLVQLVLMPDTVHHWYHDAHHILAKLRKTTEQTGIDEEGKPTFKFRQRTPGEDGVIKRIEDKLERASFETWIRYIYFAPKEVYNWNTGYRSIQAFFNQFQHDRQSLPKNEDIITRAEWFVFPYVFPKIRGHYRRVALYDEVIHRFLPEESFAGKLYNSYFWKWCFSHRPIVLSSEELATIFHIPTNVVLTQSAMERIESKRLAGPANLPE